MPVVEISTDEDQRLRSLAPSFLQDERSATKRVRWAIGEFLKSQDSNEGKSRPESDPKLKAKK